MFTIDNMIEEVTKDIAELEKQCNQQNQQNTMMQNAIKQGKANFAMLFGKVSYAKEQLEKLKKKKADLESNSINPSTEQE